MRRECQFSSRFKIVRSCLLSQLYADPSSFREQSFFHTHFPVYSDHVSYCVMLTNVYRLNHDTDDHKYLHGTLSRFVVFVMRFLHIFDSIIPVEYADVYLYIFAFSFGGGNFCLGVTLHFSGDGRHSLYLHKGVY